MCVTLLCVYLFVSFKFVVCSCADRDSMGYQRITNSLALVVENCGSKLSLLVFIFWIYLWSLLREGT
jgi:hypothetical protein